MNDHIAMMRLSRFGTLIFGLLLAASWRVLYEAQRVHRLAINGPYARVRHPQYIGFILIMIGFLVQWPTLVTLAMFPILAFMHGRLAKREEREMLARFGDEYRRYADAVPGFFPRLGRNPNPDAAMERGAAETRREP